MKQKAMTETKEMKQGKQISTGPCKKLTTSITQCWKLYERTYG